MIKRLTRKETLDEVVEMINRRHDALIAMSKEDGVDEDLAREHRLRAWELLMIVQDIDGIR